MIISFCGSSSVGKTSTLNRWAEQNPHIIPVTLSARQPRELMGNPDFETLHADIGAYHQLMILEYFKKQIENIFIKADQSRRSSSKTVYVLERSLYDVVGYTHAYLRDDKPFIKYMLMQVHQFYIRLQLQYNIPNHTIYFPINESIEYEAIAARPSKFIRNACNSYLIGVFHQSLDMKDVTSTSIEKNVEECEALLSVWRLK